MEDAVFSRTTMSGTLSDATVDFDLMDDLLTGSCWLETTSCSDFYMQGDATSATLFDSSCFLPTSGINNNRWDVNLPQKVDQDDREAPVLPDTVERQTEGLVGTHPLSETTNADRSGPSESYPSEEGKNLAELQMINPSIELRGWWIQPSASSLSVKERLLQALNYVQSSARDGDVLVQIWVPVKRGNWHVLTTCGQPFSVISNSERLARYRSASTHYHFSAEEGSNEVVGLPGRVFLGRLPEWTPDVRYFSSDEYRRVDHAQTLGVSGTIALPVFERGSNTCLGVVEVVMTTRKTNYRPELESISNALQAVNLRSSEVHSIQNPKAANNSYQIAVPEIVEVLRAVCDTHRLPLAQTWVPCVQQGKMGSRHSDESYAQCVSTVDAACYVTNSGFLGFHEACSEHHLFRGQGVAGRAFTTNQPCFSSDVTALSKSEYPLSHYAKMFRLGAAVAIRLRSIYTGNADYVLEFFLPVDCRDSEEQKLMLNSLSIIIQRICRSLRVVTDKELEEETLLPGKGSVPVRVSPTPREDDRPNKEILPKAGVTSSVVSSAEESSWISSIKQAQLKGKGVTTLTPVSLEFQKQEREGFSVTTHWDHPEVVLQSGKAFPESSQRNQVCAKDNVEHGDSSFGEQTFPKTGKTTEKKRMKTEKMISLQVLQQYFAGSLKDAAKSIGVCPTTLKRICRQHGITRWPSRQIKKVGHSLRKLQVVIDSVQGVEGAFQLSSLYADFPKSYGSDLASPNLSGSNICSTLKQTANQETLNVQPEAGTQGTGSVSQSSSCSLSSSSSLVCSTGVQQQPDASSQLGACEDASMGENQSSLLKRAYSEAELHALTKEEEKPPARSHSHKCLSNHPGLEHLHPLPKSSHVSRDSSLIRAKATYGEEKVRFSMLPSWSFQDLQQEIAKRFNIDDVDSMDLKYLDDDSEWVLLTCDADLIECKDVYKSIRAHTVKLSVHHVPHPNTRTSV